MATDAQWGFLSEADEKLICSMRGAVDDAMPAGRRMRFVLKGGEVLEGIPESLGVSAENAPPSFNTPLDPLEREQFGPNEVTITIAGQTILAQQVREVAVLPE